MFNSGVRQNRFRDNTWRTTNNEIQGKLTFAPSKQTQIQLVTPSIQHNRNMAIIITDECINCGACEPECPNNAIYEGGVEWAISDGNTVKGNYILEDGRTVDAHAKNAPVSDEYYYIVPDKCTECVGFHEEPQCAAVCPVDCCVPDPDRVESNDLLLEKKARLHL